MSWFRKHQPCDMSPAFDALDRADAAARTSSLQSRTLSRAIRCGDPIQFVEGILNNAGFKIKAKLRKLYPDMPREPLPADLGPLLAEIDKLPGVDDAPRR